MAGAANTENILTVCLERRVLVHYYVRAIMVKDTHTRRRRCACISLCTIFMVVCLRTEEWLSIVSIKRRIPSGRSEMHIFHPIHALRGDAPDLILSH